MQAHPFSVELGAGLTRSALLGAQEMLQIKVSGQSFGSFFIHFLGSGYWHRSGDGKMLA